MLAKVTFTKQYCEKRLCEVSNLPQSLHDDSGADPGFQLGWQSCAKMLKPRPLFGRIRRLQHLQSCKFQLYAKAGENTSLLASIFFQGGGSTGQKSVLEQAR